MLWYAPKEVQCPTHGRVQEEIPWAPPYARVTYRLEWRLCALCQIMTQNKGVVKERQHKGLQTQEAE